MGGWGSPYKAERDGMPTSEADVRQDGQEGKRGWTGDGRPQP